MLQGRSPCLCVISALLALASCSSSRSPIHCSADSECPPASKCVLGYCVAGDLPRARISLRTGDALFTHHPIVFEGSSSEDPNPDGGITAYDWAVKRGTTAHCDPTPASGSEPALNTIFTCEGDYEVDLVVQNTLGLQSEPASLSVAVAASSDPPQITQIGPELKLGHRCSGTPLVCTAVTSDEKGEFQLSADATDVQSASALAYEWEYKAPQGVDIAAVSVHFEPDSRSRSPLVHIESQAARMAGEWTFTVRVTDSDGLVTPAQQKVTITNSPPEVTVRRNPFVASHQFQGGIYLASDTVVADLEDPEGDPIGSTELRLVEDAPTGCDFSPKSPALKDGTLSIPFVLSASKDQAQRFVGPERHLAVVVRDVNGGETIASVPFAIQNRPPGFRWRQGVPGRDGILSVTHAVEGCGFGAPGSNCYTARFANPLEAFDQDGDPLGPVELSADGLDGNSMLTCDGQGCRVATITQDPLKFRGADSLSPFALKARVRDPWTPSLDEPSARFRLSIANNVPRIDLIANPAVTVQYREADKAYHMEATVANVVDSEGDVLTLSQKHDVPYCAVSLGGGAGSRPVIMTCRVGYDFMQFNGDLPPLQTSYSISASVSDPWDLLATTVGFVVPNRPPQNPGGPLVVNGVRWNRPYGMCIPILPVNPVWFRLPIKDPDGTPLYVLIGNPSCGKLVSPSKFGLRGSEIVKVGVDLSGCMGSEMHVAVTDGFLSPAERIHWQTPLILPPGGTYQIQLSPGC